MTYSVCILSSASISCCGFKEAYQYRSGEIIVNESNKKEMVTDKYFGANYLEQNNFVGKSEVSLQEAAKECLNKWLASVKADLDYRQRHHGFTGEYMRTFNFVKDKEDKPFYSQELRDEVMKLNCRKHVMSYVNANTERIVETHILIIDKDTAYV